MGNAPNMMIDANGGWSGGPIGSKISFVKNVVDWAKVGKFALNYALPVAASVGRSYENVWLPLTKDKLLEITKNDFCNHCSDNQLENAAGYVFENTFHEWMSTSMTYIANGNRRNPIRFGNVEPDGMGTAFVGQASAYPGAVWYEVKQTKKNIVLSYAQIRDEMNTLAATQAPAVTAGAATYILVTLHGTKVSPGVEKHAQTLGLRYGHIQAEYQNISGKFMIRFVSTSSTTNMQQYKFSPVQIQDHGRFYIQK